MGRNKRPKSQVMMRRAEGEETVFLNKLNHKTGFFCHIFEVSRMFWIWSYFFLSDFPAPMMLST